MKILVGNLTSKISLDFLQRIFGVYGSIASVSLTVDSATNETIGEVEMPDAKEALTAVTSIDGNRIEGQVIIINNKSEIINNENPKLNPEEDAGAESPLEKRKSNERRMVDSPLFKAERGIVIDRREYINRRSKSPDNQDEDMPPLEIT